MRIARNSINKNYAPHNTRNANKQTDDDATTVRRCDASSSDASGVCYVLLKTQTYARTNACMEDACLTETACVCVFVASLSKRRRDVVIVVSIQQPAASRQSSTRSMYGTAQISRVVVDDVCLLENRTSRVMCVCVCVNERCARMIAGGRRVCARVCICKVCSYVCGCSDLERLHSARLRCSTCVCVWLTGSHRMNRTTRRPNVECILVFN